MPASESCFSASSRFGGVEAPRLHGARQFRIERGDRNRDLGEVALGHPGQNVDVAHHQRRFGDDADGMAGAFQHLEDSAHDLSLALDRLVGVGVGADRDHPGFVAGGGELLLEQRRRLGLHEQLRLEIQPRREAEIGMRRSGEAVDAAVLAAAIGIDRAVEADVWGIVAGDHLARGVDTDTGLERRQLFQALPAVIESDARLGLVTAAGIGLCAPPSPSRAIDGDAKLGEI
ncbi:hypothetical protein ACVME5_005795 [Bradyrhizobium liaoningense]